jgi:uncharacterized membrane protein YhiD involved in acid resistance
VTAIHTVRALALSAAALITREAWAQLPDFTREDVWPGEGWSAFADFAFMGNALLTLALAAILGAAIGYHPRRRRAADTPEKIEAPKVYTMYAVIGAIIGIMVLKYGLVVGFVVFGIGGLIRFRTELRSATLTGQVIFVTLIGLSCGLGLPHVAVLTTAFGYVLTYILEARTTYRIEVKALPPGRVAEAAAAYRAVLEQQRCRIVSEKKSPAKERVILIFHSPHDVTRHDLDELFDTKIERALHGAVDWEID